MQWLPSFVKLFLFFVVGMMLFVVGSIGHMQFMVLGKYSVSGLFQLLQLVGWLFMVGSPLLMALKFFARLDRHLK